MLHQILRVLGACWIGLSLAGSALAASGPDPDIFDVCAIYQNPDKSQQAGIKREAIFASGKQMNRILETDEFDPNSFYILISWKKDGGFSLFRFASEQLKPSKTPAIFTDQVGQNWSLHTDMRKCK